VTRRSLLVLLRHSKAERGEGMADFDRPLSARGRRDSAMAGEWLTKHGYEPDLVLCSPARRAAQTWEGVVLGLPDPPEVWYDDRLYAAGPREMLEILRKVDTERVMVIAHNPTLEVVSAMLDPEAARELHTTGIAVHEPYDGFALLGPQRAPLVASHTARAA